MADIGNSTVYIGSPDWYIGDPDTYEVLLSKLTPSSAQVALNFKAKLDAEGAHSADPLGDRLFFEWVLARNPPTSRTALRFDSDVPSRCTFTVDILGIYAVGLTVYGANGGASDIKRSVVIGQPAAAPYNSTEYDVSWLWGVLPDFWSRLETTDKARVEVFWAGIQALVASDLMDLFNAKDALSVQSIQGAVFRKWVPLDLTVPCAASRFIIGPTDFSTYALGQRTALGLSSGVARFDGQLVQQDVVLIPGVLCQDFDRGRPIIVNIGGDEYRAKVIGKGVGRYSGAFIISSLNITSDRVPVACVVSLLTPPYQSSLIVKSGDSYYLGRALNLSTMTIDTPYVPNVNVSVPVQVSIPDAEYLGVSGGDLLIAELVNTVDKSVMELTFDILYVSGDLVALKANVTYESVLGEFFSDDLIVSDLVKDVGSRGWLGRYAGVWIGSGDVIAPTQFSTYSLAVHIEPQRVIRRSKISVDDKIKALFRLTERTSRVLYDGTQIALPTGGVITAPQPLELYENLDFYLRGRFDYGYRLGTAHDLSTFTAGGYDFAMAGVVQGDMLTVITTAGAGTYKVIELIDGDVRVDPPARTTFYSAEFYVSSPRAYVHFSADALSGSTVERLWAECAVFDNTDTVHSMYGYAVGIDGESWERKGFRSTYRDAIAALIKARVSSSTVEALDDIASLSVGIPVAPFKSRVIEIDTTFNVDVDGNPDETRVTLEEVVDGNLPAGRISAHILSSFNTLRLEETSGVSINPQTGRRYEVGDTIEQYAPLGEGVKIIDLYSANKDLFALNDIIDRHRFAVLLDVDSVVGLSATSAPFSMLTNFINEVKPAHTSFTLRLLRYLVDDIVIEDDVFLTYSSVIYDNPYHHRGPANIFDDDIHGMSDRDSAPILILTTWFPRDGVIMDEGGVFTLTSQTGGFLKPEGIPGFNAFGLSDWISGGDFVEIRNRSRIRLEITEVVDDNILKMSCSDVGNTVELARISDPQQFFVYRSLKDEVVASVTLVQDENFDVKFLGVCEHNISVGDRVSFHSNDSNGYTGLLRITEIVTDTLNDIVYARVFPRRSPAISGLGELRIYREQIIDRSLTESINVGECITHNDGRVIAIKLSKHASHLGVEPGHRLSIGGYVGAVSGHYVYLNALALPDKVPREITLTSLDTNTGYDDLDEHERAVHSSVRVIFNTEINIFNDLIKSDYLKAGDIVVLTDESITTEEGRGVFRLGTHFEDGIFLSNLPNGTLSRDLSGDATIIRQDKLHLEYFISRTESALRTFPFEATTKWGSEHWYYRD